MPSFVAAVILVLSSGKLKIKKGKPNGLPF